MTIAFIGAVPIRDQLAHLDQLVAAHEMHWAAVAQHNPRSTVMREFLRRHWDPWFTRWMDVRPGFDRQPDAALVRFVSEAAQGLAGLRELAAYNLIPTPDLGTAQHGFVTAEPSRVAGLLDDISHAFKGAVKKVTSFVHHPPGWFAAIFPLMTMENQRYWAGKLGGSSGEQLYDAGVKAVAAKYLGPQGPALVETYNKVTEDAAHGNLNAQEILAKAPEIAKLAAASKQGPDAFRAAVADTKSAVKVSGDEGERAMTWNHVGADGQSYPEVAARAVMSVSQQNPAHAYGYFRTGVQQKIYLFHTVADAHGWFSALIQDQAQPYDYVAVFALPDLSRPVSGLESFGRSRVSGDAYIGSVWPFLAGLPLGGLAGYFLRRWQEANPGLTLPGVPPGKLPAPRIPALPSTTSGDPYVGCPWPVPYGEHVGDDYGPYVGCGDGPYVGCGDHVGDWIGAYQSQHRPIYHPHDSAAAAPRSWPQTKALIQSAVREVMDAHNQAPAEAYVWSLDPPGPSMHPGVELTGVTSIVPFSSHAQALDYMRERIQTPHVALAVFDTQSRWPNPTNWTKSDDPAHESVIAQQIAKYQTTRSAGDYYGTAIGSAVDDVRTRAQTLAAKRAGDVVGVIHTSKDGLWHTIAFLSSDDADDWLGTATHDPSSYTYAAYYDKADFQWPRPVNEKIGGGRTRSTGSAIRRGIATTSGWAA